MPPITNSRRLIWVGPDVHKSSRPSGPVATDSELSVIMLSSSLEAQMPCCTGWRCKAASVHIPLSLSVMSSRRSKKLRYGPRSGSSFRIPHCPHWRVTSPVFIADPRRSTDMQIGIWGFIEHDPCACISDCRRQPTDLRIEGPHDHPMWSDRYGWTSLVKRIGVAMLCRSTEHVTQPRNSVRGLRLTRMSIHEPLHRHRVRTHGRIADHVFISGHADPLIGSFPKHSHFAVFVFVHHRRILGDFRRSSEHGALNLDLNYLFSGCLIGTG